MFTNVGLWLLTKPMFLRRSIALRSVLPKLTAHSVAINGEINFCNFSTCSAKPTSTLIERKHFLVASCTAVSRLSKRNAASKKSSKKGKQQDDDSDEEDEDEGDAQTSEEAGDLGRDYKDITAHVRSLRVDGIVKAGLGISKTLVEDSFYEGKLRINGENVNKKSSQVNVGDEIDLIKGVNTQNPSFTDISRVVVLDHSGSTTKHDKIQVTLRRFKNMTVDIYKV